MKKVYKSIVAVALGLSVGFGAAPVVFAEGTAKPAPAKVPAAAAIKTPITAKAKTPPPISIIWRGDRATERAFVADLAKEYEAARLGKITMQPFSTISGIDAVHDGTADVAGSARPAMPGRVEEDGLTFYPVAWEALVPITSPKNPVDNVSLHELYQIYLGRTRSWQALGGADDPINLYAVAAPLDGIEYSLRKLIYKKGDQAVSVPRLYLNTARLEEGIAIDPHGMGFTTLSAVYANKTVKMLKVEGMGATSTTIADGTYPLYSALYLAARSDSKNHDVVEKFIQYASSAEGKAILRRHQLVPYDDAPALVEKEDQHMAVIEARLQAELAAAPEISTTASASLPAAVDGKATTAQARADVPGKAATAKDK